MIAGDATPAEILSVVCVVLLIFVLGYLMASGRRGP